MVSFKNLSYTNKAAQCVFPRLNVNLFIENTEYKNFIIELVKLGCGGFCIFDGNTEQVKKITSELQFWSNIPLMFVADFENGLQMRLEDGTSFPHHFALAKANQKNVKSKDWTKQVSIAIAKEAKSIGIHWNLAPVADINSNKSNPVINIRSFGENKNIVTENCNQYILGTQSENVAACVKHFPGHGDTSTDSHIQLPIINKKLEELEENEIVPFVEAMQNGVTSIMIGHLIVNKWNSICNEVPGNPYFPASLSSNVVKYIRNINSDVIILTDALDMQGVNEIFGNKTGLYAFKAGIDIVLMPANPIETIKYIAEVLEQEAQNNLPENQVYNVQIESTFKRLYKLKQWTKLIPQHTVITDSQPKLFSEHLQLALKAAVDATEIYNVNSKYACVPIPEGIQYSAFSIIQKNEDIQTASRFFTMLAQATENNCDYGYLDENISQEELENIADGIAEAELIIFALFYRGRGHSKQLASAEKINNIIKHIAEGRNYIVICFGDPYIAEKINANTKILTYSDSFASLASAVMLLTGRKMS